MKNLIRWINKNRKNWHPVLLALHVRGIIAALHPSEDENGRLGSLLGTYVYLVGDFPPVLGTRGAAQDSTTFGELKEPALANILGILDGKYPGIKSYNLNPAAFWQARDYKTVFVSEGERDNFISVQKHLGQEIIDDESKALAEQVLWLKEHISHQDMPSNIIRY